MLVMKVKGIDKVVKGFARHKKNVGKGVENGLIVAATVLRRESVKIVPVQIGHLRASWFMSKKGSGLNAVVTCGYASGPQSAASYGRVLVKNKKYAPYAELVHEIPGLKLTSPVTHGELFNIKHAVDIEAAKGTKWGTVQGGMFKRKPEEQWKYLEKPVRTKHGEVLAIIRRGIQKVV